MKARLGEFQVVRVKEALFDVVVLCEQLGPLFHVHYGLKDCIVPDINKFRIGTWRRVGHASDLVEPAQQSHVL